ncbi:hypothetical protein FJ420_02045 [Mesorhizobium sp. B3-1-3]|uniref:helix-turn-helix domain-containing protein n=1 Tax=unclassified Mesorhizobium TaxID=325217 RepID=UPI001125F1E8|nr:MULTISPECIES: helix-turn-helix domain-containing protein [unclassified Mesorhizobium]TPI67612.1 hypothetical protein FJ424_10015 [Mesorhizobium sp. B3-1-8]TPI75658.1 hypothetical protein FJ420_02045 [Mesorhizobium sp. B3-1-3]
MTKLSIALGSIVNFNGSQRGTVVGHYATLYLVQCDDLGAGHNGFGYKNLELLDGFEPGKRTDCWYFPKERLQLVSAPAKEPTAPMTKSVLDLLRRKGAITSLEAQGVLRCRQLPARVLELKRLGHKIVTEMKIDPTGQKYARYHLEAA